MIIAILIISIFALLFSLVNLICFLIAIYKAGQVSTNTTRLVQLYHNLVNAITQTTSNEKSKKQVSDKRRKK